MGYTHYWYLKQGIKKLSDRCLSDLKKVAEEHKEIIQFESDDKDKPLIKNKEIRFNGIGEEGHETFLFSLKKGGKFIQEDEDGFVFECCKTARKPYDLVVCKMLLILKAELQDKIKLSSDGFSNCVCSFDGDWSNAIERVKRMDYKIDCNVCSRDNGESPYYDCEIKSVKKLEVKE